MTRPPPSACDKPARVLGGVSATCVVIGAIIGVGIFITPNEVAQTTERESLVLLAWALGGFLAICGALVFAELGGMFTGDGAQYAILRDGYGPLPAYLFVFCIATIIQPGTITLIALTCAKYLLLAADISNPPGWWLLLLAALMIGLLTAANVIGVKVGASIQNLTVYGKVLALVAVTLLAVFASPESVKASEANVAAAPMHAPAVALMAALVPVLFSFGGWQQVMWIAGEVREPKRNLPRAIIIGVLIVIVVYLSVNWAYLELLGFEKLRDSSTVAADAVGHVYSWGRSVIAGAVAISAFGVLNANILTGPRLVYGMARDGRFFPVFARLAPRFGTPAASIVFTSALALVMLFVAGNELFTQLLFAVVLIDVVFFLLTVSALFIFRKTMKDVERPIKCPGYPVVPVIFLLGELGALVASFLTITWTAIASLAWIAAGLLTYFLWFRRRGDQLGPASRS